MSKDRDPSLVEIIIAMVILVGVIAALVGSLLVRGFTVDNPFTNQ